MIWWFVIYQCASQKNYKIEASNSIQLLNGCIFRPETRLANKPLCIANSQKILWQGKKLRIQHSFYVLPPFESLHCYNSEFLREISLKQGTNIVLNGQPGNVLLDCKIDVLPGNIHTKMQLHRDLSFKAYDVTIRPKDTLCFKEDLKTGQWETIIVQSSHTATCSFVCEELNTCVNGAEQWLVLNQNNLPTVKLEVPVTAFECSMDECEEFEMLEIPSTETARASPSQEEDWVLVDSDT